MPKFNPFTKTKYFSPYEDNLAKLFYTMFLSSLSPAYVDIVSTNKSRDSMYVDTVSSKYKVCFVFAWVVQ